MKIKVGVIFGGMSVEHEVSIITAIQAINKMDLMKYDVYPIYITKDGEWYTGGQLKDIETFSDMNLLKRYAKRVVLYKKDEKFVMQSKGLFKKIITDLDIAFPIMHGTNGEDGVLQGYLQTIGIPYVGSSVYASVVGQDKIFMKQIFKENGLNIVDYIWFFDSEYKNDKDAVIKKAEKLSYPMVVKPATLGSSVGISIAKDKKELINAIEDAIDYDTKIVIEKCIENLKEVNISVLGNYEHQELSVIEEVNASNHLLTYDDKYLNNKKTKSKGMESASRKIPADISDKLVEEVRATAITAFKALNSAGVVRIDYLINNKNNKLYINEINSIPGSLSFYLWSETNKSYTELLDQMISISIKDYQKRINKTHTFQSNILKGFNGTKGIKGLKGIKK